MIITKGRFGRSCGLLAARQIARSLYRDFCPQVLRDNTAQWYDWSFYLAWLGVATCLGTMTLFLIAASCLRRERAREQAQNVQYIMPGDTIPMKWPN